MVTKLTSVLTLNILELFLAEKGTSTKQRNIILSKLGRQCMHFSNEFVILIFQLICSCIYLTMLFALYGCEIWGFENSKIIENLHSDFLRQITNLRKSTPIHMLHAELGRHPIQINIKSRMIGFWLSIVNGKEFKLSKLLYSIMLKEHEKGSCNFKWILCINYILDSCSCWPT